MGGCGMVRADKSTDLGIVANWRQRQLVVEEQGHKVVTGKRNCQLLHMCYRG